MELTRRRALGGGLAALALGPSLIAMARPLFGGFSAKSIGPLGDPDPLGVRLPPGFRARVIARSGQPVIDREGRPTGYTWHPYPDGGATFSTSEGGWIYVSNAEAEAAMGGGAGSLRFDREGQVVASARILGGTHHNCAGGPTPWGSWLSCEEHARGRVWECDPGGARAAVPREALGVFAHEAAAVDPATGCIYLTEDHPQGRLYRFRPSRFTAADVPDLREGRLEVAVVAPKSRRVSWRSVPEPAPSRSGRPTREQVPQSTAFNGGEGIWHAGGKIYFTSKGDDRVWCLTLSNQLLSLVYDASTSPEPVLQGVDNLVVSESGRVVVAEDGGDMQLVVLDASGGAAPLLQVVGQDHSEITGPAFSPDGGRLYFSSQRGPSGGVRSRPIGLTYEVTGPFHRLLG